MASNTISWIGNKVMDSLLPQYGLSAGTDRAAARPLTPAKQFARTFIPPETTPAVAGATQTLPASQNMPGANPLVAGVSQTLPATKDLAAAQNYPGTYAPAPAVAGVSQILPATKDLAAAQNYPGAYAPAPAVAGVSQTLPATKGLAAGPSYPAVYTPTPAVAGVSQTLPMTQSSPSASLVQQGPPPTMDRSYIPGYLAENIGRNVRAEFIIGTNQYADRTGRLVEVGSNYFVLHDINSGTLVMCDLYSVKFVTIII